MRFSVLAHRTAFQTGECAVGDSFFQEYFFQRNHAGCSHFASASVGTRTFRWMCPIGKMQSEKSPPPPENVLVMVLVLVLHGS